MYSTELTLLSSSIIPNKIGVQEEYTTKTVIPIMRIEDIYANEFFQASQQGYKPTLRVVISALNYDGQDELIYMNETYSIIRKQLNGDELILICERKLKNVK